MKRKRSQRVRAPAKVSTERTRSGRSLAKSSSSTLSSSLSTTDSPYKYEVRFHLNDKPEGDPTAPVSKSTFEALLKFERPVNGKDMILKTGAYLVDGKRITESRRDDEETKATKDGDVIFALNPTRKAFLPVLGVALAIGNPSSLKDRIFVFRPKAALADHYLLDLTASEGGGMIELDPSKKRMRTRRTRPRSDT